jgi:hypothetical protein
VLNPYITKTNRRSILIQRPIADVFEYVINPENTHLWIDSVKKEAIAEDPVKMGGLYIRTDKQLIVRSYRITKFKENEVIEKQVSSPFIHIIRYTFTSISENETRFGYFEKFTKDRHIPIKLAPLIRLKELLEHPSNFYTKLL